MRGIRRTPGQLLKHHSLVNFKSHKLWIFYFYFYGDLNCLLFMGRDVKRSVSHSRTRNVLRCLNRKLFSFSDGFLFKEVAGRRNYESRKLLMLRLRRICGLVSVLLFIFSRWLRFGYDVLIWLIVWSETYCVYEEERGNELGGKLLVGNSWNQFV